MIHSASLKYKGHFYKSNFRHYTALLTKNNSYIYQIYTASLFYVRALSNLKT